MTEVETLLEFLELPLWTSEDIFEKFRYHHRAITREHPSDPKKRFVYIHGALKEKVVLVAHADTFFDEEYEYPKTDHTIVEENEWIRGDGKNAIGADDRAGCAMLYLLKDFGHSILITDGEEYRQKGSKWLMQYNPDIAALLNDHQFMVQLDLKGASHFKCYDVGTDAFREFIESKSGYKESGRENRTDIADLCRDVCGVNFSIGSYGEHTPEERINIREWENTLSMIKKILGSKLPRFSLDKIQNI